MNRSDIISELTIEDITSEGKAVGRYNSMVIFVPGLVPGDVAEVQITKKKKSFAEARLLNIVNKSPSRVEAICKHFGICGGCKWQNLSYEGQLSFKQNYVSETLRRLSGLELPAVKPILASGETFGYRNKLEFTFSNKRWLLKEEEKQRYEISDWDALGFHVPGRYDKVLDIEECHLQDDVSNQIRNKVRSLAKEAELPFYDLRSRAGLLRNLIIRTSTTGEVLVVLVVSAWSDGVEQLLEKIGKAFPAITSLNYVVNNKSNDSIQDLEVVCFAGKDHMEEKLAHLKYKIGPKSFFQTNSRQAERLFHIVAEFADLHGEEIVYDLYTGAGAIANYLSGKCRKVIGLESVEAAVSDAILNAGYNNISNAEFFAGDIRFLMKPEFFEKHGKPDVIVTDPPRAGMHPDAVEAIASSQAKKIVYVSCNPATQARDFKVLSANYRVAELQPVDMFPHTSHIENIALLLLK